MPEEGPPHSKKWKSIAAICIHHETTGEKLLTLIIHQLQLYCKYSISHTSGLYEYGFSNIYCIPFSHVLCILDSKKVFSILLQFLFYVKKKVNVCQLCPFCFLACLPAVHRLRTKHEQLVGSLTLHHRGSLKLKTKPFEALTEVQNLCLQSLHLNCSVGGLYRQLW